MRSFKTIDNLLPPFLFLKIRKQTDLQIMPLPPALLARLAKRGIVEEEKANKPDPSSGSAKAGNLRQCC